jgi:hypothetical protein
MVMTGSQDRGIDGQPPAWREEPFRFSPPEDKYLVFIKGANHMTFTGRPAQIGIQPESRFEDIRMAGLAFCEAGLKQRREAKEWLASDALETYSHGGAKLSRK